ncbi:MAG TPA: hypothetical protein VF284_10235 [Rhodanobacteraceae bacterium]
MFPTSINGYLKTHHDVTAIGLDVDEESQAQITNFLSHHTFDFPLATLPAAEATKFSMEVAAIPDIWVIAPNGTTTLSRMGGINAPRLARLIHQAGYPDAQH